MGCSKVLQRAFLTVMLAVSAVVLSAAPQDRVEATFRSAADVVSMAAPRPLLVQQCEKDGLFPLAGMKESLEVIAKVYEKGGAKEALLFPGDPTDPANVPIRFSYRPPAGYLATDAAQLPDGKLIVLNRHFSFTDGFRAALTVIDPRDIQGGAELKGELLAEFRPPLNIDNMEGISVTRERGHTILWLISDDNQISLQRTLLMKFAQ